MPFVCINCCLFVFIHAYVMTEIWIFHSICLKSDSIYVRLATLYSSARHFVLHLHFCILANAYVVEKFYLRNCRCQDSSVFAGGSDVAWC